MIIFNCDEAKLKTLIMPGHFGMRKVRSFVIPGRK